MVCLRLGMYTADCCSRLASLSVQHRSLMRVPISSHGHYVTGCSVFAVREPAPPKAQLHRILMFSAALPDMQLPARLAAMRSGGYGG